MKTSTVVCPYCSSDETGDVEWKDAGCDHCDKSSDETIVHKCGNCAGEFVVSIRYDPDFRVRMIVGEKAKKK